MDADDRHRPADVIPLDRARVAARDDAPSDDALMELACAGSVPHYGQLVQRHQARLRAYCASWCGDRAAADDLAQEVLLDLWRARRQYRPSGRFTAYLFTLARNRCHSARRRRPALTADAALPEAAAGAPMPLDQMVAAERSRRIDEALATLPDKLREAVLLRFRADLDYPDIARMLGKPEPTIRSRVFLGIKRLRRALKGEGE